MNPRARLENERGSVSLLMVVLSLGLLLSVGLVVDGGAKIRAVQQADRVAAEAARAATQQVDTAAVLRGTGAALSPAAATAAGRAVLEAAGATGTVTPGPGGSVEVTASITRPTIFLGLVGVPEVTGTGRAQARLTID